MKTYALLIALLALAAVGCNPNKSCTHDSECDPSTGGFCDTTIGHCAYYPIDAGVAGWTLSLTSPANNARVNATAQVAANLTYVGGTSPMPPTSLTLLATPTTGSSVTGTLAKTGTTTYSGTLPSGLITDQTYTLQAQFPGGASDGGTLVSTDVIAVVFDSVAPTFTLSVPPPAARTPHANLVVYDPDATFDGGQAYRRDESVVVTVNSAADVDAGSVKLTVTGIGTGATATSVPLSACAAPDGNYCATATIDLSQPQMSAFHGDFLLTASGVDTAGNVATAAAGVVGVTRWKWSYGAAGTPNIKASPAVGHLGSIYFGSTTGGGGSLYALNPDGTQKWAPVAVGSVLASPAVGAWDAGYEVVYVGAKNGSTGALSAFNSVDGSAYGTTPSYSTGTTDVQASLVVAPTNVSTDVPTIVESAISVMTISGGGRLVALRPLGGTSAVTASGGVSTVHFPGNVVSDGTNYYFGDVNTTPTVEGFSFGTPVQNSFSPLGGNWPVTIGGSLNTLNSLALGASSLFGMSNGGIFGLTTPAGASTKFPTGLNGAAAFGVVLAGSNALYGDDSGKLKLIPFSLSALDAQPAANGNIHAAPLVGSDARVYTADTGSPSGIQAWSPAFTSEWVGTFAADIFEASPNIDCARDGSGSKLAGRPGVLYAGNNDGHLYAIVVDSPGIDTTPGDWPKYQHDPRNTGNSSTTLTEFQCQ